MNITKDEKLYGGRDYLPHWLRTWLEQGIDKQSNRCNVVFLLENQIVGYRMLFLQNGGTVVVFNARRIPKNIRGKGFGRKISELTIEYLKSNYPNVTQRLSVIADLNLPDSEVFNSKHGELLTKKSVALYQVKFQEMTDLLAKYAASLPEPRNENQFLTEDEFKQVLRNEDFVNGALENETLLMKWDPILLKSVADINFARIGNFNFLLEGSTENPIALSVLTQPYPIADGQLNLFFDFYTCKSDISRMSVVEHLNKHLVFFNKFNGEIENRVTIFEIFAFQKDLQQVIQNMEKAGLGEKLYVCGKQNRKFQNSYVYKKDLE